MKDPPVYLVKWSENWKMFYHGIQNSRFRDRKVWNVQSFEMLKNAGLRLMDTVYSISEGKIKTSKSIPLPSIVKSMVNINELVTILKRLAHGV